MVLNTSDLENDKDLIDSIMPDLSITKEIINYHEKENQWKIN